MARILRSPLDSRIRIRDIRSDVGDFELEDIAVPSQGLPSIGDYDRNRIDSQERQTVTQGPWPQDVST